MSSVGPASRAIVLVGLPGTLLDHESVAALAACVSAETGWTWRTERVGVAAHFTDEIARIATMLCRDGASQRIVLVGHSLGGIAALELAVRHPACLAGIVVIASNARADSTIGEAKRSAQRTWAANRGIASLARECLAADFGREADAAIVAALGAQAERTGLAQFERQLAYAAERPGLLLPRRPVNLPVLALAGAADAACPPTDAAAIAALGRSGSSRFAVHDRAGHLLPMEEAGWCARQIADFVADLPLDARAGEAPRTRGQTCAPIA